MMSILSSFLLPYLCYLSDLPSGILARIEPNKDAAMARVTVRSTNDVVSREMMQLLSNPLNRDRPHEG